MIRFFFLVIIFLLAPSYVTFAISNDFNIKVLVGGDVIPPTTPTLLSVVPVSYSQIDINWSAATDNFALAGYVLIRDGVSIATTTLTSFNDTGLTPSTLYTYEVYAFDNFFNISTTSNSLATSTFSATPIPASVSTTTENNSKIQSTRIPSLENFEITTTNHEARFTWGSLSPTRYTLRWGKNNEYNGGYISNDTYKTLHDTVINDLESNTQYFFELVGHFPSGVSRVLKTGQFITKPEVNNFPPPNVLRLSAVVDNNDVELSWQIPATVGIKSIRVVSSPYKYPVNIDDGEIVYDGLGSKVFDEKALSQNNSKYYSVFVIDEKGNISSGAVLLVNKNTLNEKSKNPINKDDDLRLGSSSISIKQEDLQNKGEMSLHDFDPENIKITQNNSSFDFGSDKINLIYQESFTISIPYEAVPRHLKSIIITLLDPTDNRRSYSFLLRINKAGTAYESTIAPLNVLGSSRLQVEIFDFESQLIGLYRKQIDFTVKSKEAEDQNQEVVFPDKIIDSVKDSLIFLSFIPVLLIFFIFLNWLRKRGEDN